jgi:hypothetical protein
MADVGGMCPFAGTRHHDRTLLATMRRDEKWPAGEAEDLDDGRQHPDGRRDWDELEPVAGEYLAD